MLYRFIAGAAVVLFGITGLFAEGTPAATPAGTTTTIGGTSITWYGLGMIRLREDIIMNKDVNDSTVGSHNYLQKLAYRIGAKIKPSDVVSLQFEIGNEWYATETVSGGDYMGAGKAGSATRNVYDPLFLLAFAQWDPGFMHIQAGILPMKGSATMDLIGCSFLFDKQYFLAAPATNPLYGMHACQLPWGVTANFMYPGLRVGAPILSGDVKLGVDVFSSVSQERVVTPAFSSVYRNNNSAIFNVIDIPIAVSSLTLSPQFVMILNRNYRDTVGIEKKSDNEIALGIDAGYKLNKQVSFRAGVGMSSIANANTIATGETAYERHATNITLGSSIMAGPGKLDLDFNLGTAVDKKAVLDKTATFQFIDVKYGWAVAKNFTVMPRTRVYLDQIPVTTDVSAKVFRVWPELILFGTF